MTTRNPNVRQQNALSQEAMLNLAREFRVNPLRYHWLVAALVERLQSATDGILVDLKHIPEQCGDEFSGHWLTTDQRFFQFRVMVPRANEDPNVIERWEDVTDSIPINAHQPGTGKSFGCLALEVLAECMG